MKLKSLLLLGATAFSFNTYAQTWVADSVEMGASYANDIFYSLKNGQQKSESNTNWHIAFQTLPPLGANSNVSIIANHVAGKVNVYSLHLSATAKFGALTNTDTIGKVMLYNTDTSWNFGAFNRMNDAGNPFDYSWGAYNMTSHSVVGDSLYLITINNAAYQVWVQEYKSTPSDSISYRVRIADFNGNNDKTIRVYRKNGYTDRNFAYYDVVNDAIRDREPSRTAWDMVFTRAIEFVAAGPGPLQPYPVTTVYSNFGVSVAEVNDLNPSTTGYDSKPYLNDIHVIGSDWKKAPMGPGSWTMRDSAHYFIKTNNTNEYYQLHFTNFYGSSNGRAVFEKRKLGDVTSVKNINTSVAAYSIAPNPAVNETSIMIDAKEAAGNTAIFVTDITGKIVEKHIIKLNAGLNAFRINTSNYASGTYMVTIANGDWKATQKLAVQH